MDYRPPGSSVHGISQVRILLWVTISFSRANSQRERKQASGSGAGVGQGDVTASRYGTSEG